MVQEVVENDQNSHAGQERQKAGKENRQSKDKRHKTKDTTNHSNKIRPE